VVGCITDGDLRRMLEKHTDYSKLKAEDVMSANPKTLTEDVLAVEALELMKKKNITSIFVVDENGFYLGVLHLHDIIKEGIY
jgi:arabinose-5-phosphate isomerase